METTIKTYETLGGKFDAVINGNEYQIFKGSREEYGTKGYNEFLVPYFKEKTGYELPPVFVSMTSKYRENAKALADCTRYSDRIEISFNAQKVKGETVEDTLRFWDIMVHEGIHACGIGGHKKDFADIGKKLGLTGSGENNNTWTATISTPQLDEAILKTIVNKLGLYPQHEFEKQAKKKEPIRNLKIECSNDCGYSHRQSMKNFNMLIDKTCGACKKGEYIIA